MPIQSRIENGIKHHTDMDLDSMKYAELRSLAKELGLKANMKADKLLKAIKQHYQQEPSKGEEAQGQEVAVQEDQTATQEESAQENEEASCEEEVCSPTVFVNTRRGRGRTTKRKISDPAPEDKSDAKIPPSALEGRAEVAASSRGKGAKKRKMSPTKDCDKSKTDPPTSGEQQKPDTKDEAPVHANTEKAQKATQGCKIPRYNGPQTTKPVLKPITPNFKKLHEAHFKKMESIDSYFQRKTKQMETYKNSVKELKKLSEKTKLKQDDAKPQVKSSRTSLFSPAPMNKKAAEERRRHTLLSASKAPPTKPDGKEKAPFKPTVLSTRRINVRFSEATHDNEYKRSLLKTPARMSPCVTSSTPQKPATDVGQPNMVKTSTLSASKTPGPFVFTGNTSTSKTPGTQKKPNFDLKASLSRPLNYKPHTGKLKPFGETKENPAANKSLVSNSHQKNYKQHQVQTREDRRAKHTEGRKQKKENMLGARRGLVMM